MKSQDLAKYHLPDSPGVYYFLDGKRKPIYIGKATSLKDRVKSYFSKDLFETRGPLLVKMLEEAKSIKFVATDSVLEALILEAHEVKEKSPVYNSKLKDDKSFNFVTITKEEFPKVVITRGSGDFGPFPKSTELKEALKIIRKIFPFRDEKCKLTGRPCFNAQLGLCPGPCAGLISKKDYKKQVNKIKLFFEAKKPKLVKALEKEMHALAKARNFEEAEKVKRQIFALDHIQDIALIKQEVTTNAGTFRIEAYDIAHLSGKDVVGVMTVVEDGELNKSQYRKFKIKVEKNDDVGNLREVLQRRLKHTEWRMPNLVVIDGGEGQLNVAKKELLGTGIEIVSVVKNEAHKAREILALKDDSLKNQILLANNEAHRFAIGYHRKLRNKGFRI